MPEIRKIKLGDTTYDIRDAKALHELNLDAIADALNGMGLPIYNGPTKETYTEYSHGQITFRPDEDTKIALEFPVTDGVLATEEWVKNNFIEEEIPSIIATYEILEGADPRVEMGNLSNLQWVDWGDGTLELDFDSSTSELSHDYEPGTYTCKIYGPTEIGEETFPYNHTGGWQGLIAIELSNKITAIGDRAFLECMNLKAVKLSDGLETIGVEAFQACTALTAIRIPDSVTSIGEGAFSNCSLLSLVELSNNNNLTDLSPKVFEFCYALNTITFPKSLITIGDYSFQYSSLQQLILPPNVQSIGSYAFAGVTLKSLVIPSSVTSIGEAAFWGINNLKVTFEAITPITYNDWFDSDAIDSSTIQLVVPREAIDTYSEEWPDLKYYINSETPATQEWVANNLGGQYNSFIKFVSFTNGILTVESAPALTGIYLSDTSVIAEEQE